MTIFNIHFELLPFVLLCVCAASFVYLLFYYGLHHLRIALYKNKKSSTNNATPSVSIVLTAKNEEFFLSENLTYLLNQDYPCFEVIVVDLASNDGTQYVLQQFKDKYNDKLNIVRFSNEITMYRGKKYPLSIGIQSAKNDIILLTDVDCVPESTSWIREMVKPFDNKKTNIVLGFSNFTNHKSILNDFIQFDNVSYFGSIFGKALMHLPYAGCGRNIAYRRKFFFEKNGFIYHYHIPVGDDDLFVNWNATGSNVAVCNTQKSFVITPSKKSCSSWSLQRKKRFISRKYFRFKNKLSMAWHPLFVLIFYITGVCTYLFMPEPILGSVLLGTLLLKIIWQIICFYQLCKHFEIQKHIAIFAPLFELYFLFSNTFLSIFTLRQKNVKWK